MAAPLTAPWSVNTPLSPASLNASTHGSGTTAERTALAAWPTDRLFYDTTDKNLYYNAGAANAPAWRIVNRRALYLGTGALGDVVIAADANFPAGGIHHYRNLTVNAGRTLSSQPATQILYVQQTIRVLGTINADGVGALRGAGGAANNPGNPGNPGYNAGTAGTAGSGGVGGAGGAGGYGQPNLAVFDLARDRRVRVIPDYLYGAGGGGGGGSGNITPGGNGGRGGGGIIIFANTVDITGTISAQPNAGSHFAGGGGTGGAGGGGIIFIRANTITNNGTYSVGDNGYLDVST